MPSVTRSVMMLFGVACVLLAGSMAQAASVVWTIDSTATSIQVGGTGYAPVSGITLETRVIIQGTTPLASATPMLPVKVSGQLVTDTDFTSSIKFLKTGTIIGENTGDFKPNPTAGYDLTTYPGEVGSTLQVKFGISWVNAVEGTLRNMEYDFSGPSAIAISGGSFSTSSLTMYFTTGDLDYHGYGPGAGLDSGTTEVDRKIPGDANFDRIVDGGDYTIWADDYLATGQQFYQGDFSGDGLVDGGDYTLWADNYLSTDGAFQQGPNSAADASIAKSGGTYTLTIPLSSTVPWIIDDGDDTATTTDDIFVNLNFNGTLVATAPVPAESSAIPEPSTLALSLVAGLGMALVGLHRKLRRA